MPYGERERTTVYIPKELISQAKIKSGKSGSAIIEQLLIDYVSIDGSIEELKRFKDQSKKIIREEQKKIKQYEECIKEKEQEQRLNAKNTIIISECISQIDRYYSNYNIISMDFLKKLSKVKNVPLSDLASIVDQKNYQLK